MHSNLEKIGLQFLFFFQKKGRCILYRRGICLILHCPPIGHTLQLNQTKSESEPGQEWAEKKRSIYWKETNKQRRKGNVVTIPPPTLSLSLFLSVLVSSPYSPNRLPSFAFFLFAKKNRLYPTWSSRNKKRKQYRDRNYRVSGKHVTLAYSIYRPFPISSSLQPKKIEGAMAGSKEVCFCLLLILVSLSREHPSALLSSVFFLIKR